jgi:hypothetical protein
VRREDLAVAHSSQLAQFQHAAHLEKRRYRIWYAGCKGDPDSKENAMTSRAILVGVCVFATSGAAVANPIMMIDEAYAQQFPHTAHVQLTQEASMSRPSTMSITRDGEVVTPTTLRSDTTSADLGSGMDDIYWASSCDCNVPIGHHSYTVNGKNLEVEVVDAAAANGALQHFSAGCDMECPSVPVPPAGGSGGEGGAGGAAGEAGAPLGPSSGGVSAAGGAGGAAEPSGGAEPAGGADTQVPTQTGGSSATGGAATGGVPATGGRATGGLSATGGRAPATGGTAPATGGTHSVVHPAPTGGKSSQAPTGASGASTAGAGDTAGTAPEETTARKHRDSSGCAISRARGTLAPFGILAALGLLAWRRKQ